MRFSIDNARFLQCWLLYALALGCLKVHTTRAQSKESTRPLSGLPPRSVDHEDQRGSHDFADRRLIRRGYQRKLPDIPPEGSPGREQIVAMWKQLKDERWSACQRTSVYLQIVTKEGMEVPGHMEAYMDAHRKWGGALDEYDRVCEKYKEMTTLHLPSKLHSPVRTTPLDHVRQQHAFQSPGSEIVRPIALVRGTKTPPQTGPEQTLALASKLHQTLGVHGAGKRRANSPVNVAPHPFRDFAHPHQSQEKRLRISPEAHDPTDDSKGRPKHESLPLLGENHTGTTSPKSGPRLSITRQRAVNLDRPPKPLLEPNPSPSRIVRMSSQSRGSSDCEIVWDGYQARSTLNSHTKGTQQNHQTKGSMGGTQHCSAGEHQHMWKDSKQSSKTLGTTTGSSFSVPKKFPASMILPSRQIPQREQYTEAQKSPNRIRSM